MSQDNDCDFCHGWRPGKSVTITGDNAKLLHAVEAGMGAVLMDVGSSKYMGHHYWMVEVLDGAYKDHTRSVACEDMTPVQLTKDEEQEVLARILTSVQRGET